MVQEETVRTAGRAHPAHAFLDGRDGLKRSDIFCEIE
jgi:hypothetical protein